MASHRQQERSLLIYRGSSVARAAVSKTACREFESLPRCQIGALAERLGSGLQIPQSRFDSAAHLQKNPVMQVSIPVRLTRGASFQGKTTG